MAAASLQHLADIEDIRQLSVNYARATDALGSADEQTRQLGRRIYHRTFAPEAEVQAGDSAVLVGPDAWADYVSEALAPFSSTQHLIGTIDVRLEEGADNASMSTYLHANHEYSPGGNVYIVLGTYEDEVARTPDGWRIVRRTLHVTSSENRHHA